MQYCEKRYKYFFLFPTGRCAGCGENVVGEGTGCTAMDQVFHVDCFACMTCSSKLRGKPFYALEKKAYCEACYIVSVIHYAMYTLRECTTINYLYLWDTGLYIFFNILFIFNKLFILYWVFVILCYHHNICGRSSFSNFCVKTFYFLFCSSKIPYLFLIYPCT